MIAYVIPTRDRHDELARTLEALGSLSAHDPSRSPNAVPGEVVVIDNHSERPVVAPNWLANGVPVRVDRRPTNEGAAARNVGVRLTSVSADWVVMLDDDSAPMGDRHVELLRDVHPDVAAVSADIFLPDGSRERGGLPEVFIGCGVAIRRWAFEAVGGYDRAFGYYAEEYDLSARLMLAHRRVAFEPGFRVLHRKVTGGRDMDLILARLVRNNGWVLARYCPDDELAERLQENESRYRTIAEKESARVGFDEGLTELRATINAQPRTPMPTDAWDRFTGLAQAREALGCAHAARPFRSAAIVERGKNAWAVERVLAELGVTLVEGSPESADAVVVGTLSPGPMLDAAQRLAHAHERVIAPWTQAQRAIAPSDAVSDARRSA